MKIRMSLAERVTDDKGIHSLPSIAPCCQCKSSDLNPSDDLSTKLGNPNLLSVSRSLDSLTRFFSCSLSDRLLLLLEYSSSLPFSVPLTLKIRLFPISFTFLLSVPPIPILPVLILDSVSILLAISGL